jgi:hypothetical protein
VGLLLACYFAHILAAVLALAGIGVLWLASWRRERWRGHLAHLAILAPAAVLPVWFTMVRPGSPSYPSDAAWQTLWSDLAHLRTLWQFSAEHGHTGAILAKVFAAWIAFTLLRAAVARRPGTPAGTAGTSGTAVSEGRTARCWWWREEDGFLVLALLLAGFYFLSPGGTAGGGLLKPRLLLYPFLVVLPWLSTAVGRWGKAAAVVALGALAAYPVTWAVPCYRAGARDVEAFVRGLDAVPPGSVVVPLVFDRHTTSCMRSGSVDHAAGYAAVAKGLVDWDNYEAQTDLFPVRFRPWAVRPTSLGVENDPLHVRVHELRSRVDYIYCWRMPPGAPVVSGACMRRSRPRRSAPGHPRRRRPRTPLRPGRTRLGRPGGQPRNTQRPGPRPSFARVSRSSRSPFPWRPQPRTIRRWLPWLRLAALAALRPRPGARHRIDPREER